MRICHLKHCYLANSGHDNSAFLVPLCGAPFQFRLIFSRLSSLTIYIMLRHDLFLILCFKENLESQVIFSTS